MANKAMTNQQLAEPLMVDWLLLMFLKVKI